jgi:thymidine kinase
MNTDYSHGYLQIVIGCMFSGKTTYLIRECMKWKSIDKKVLVINYKEDTRYSNENKTFSHDKISVDSLMVYSLNDVSDEYINEYDIILVNEGQFFTNIVNKIKTWVNLYKKYVIISGLDGDFRKKQFGEILQLVPECDDIIKLSAMCSLCKNGQAAPFTWKLTDNNVSDNNIIDIGVSKYTALCRKHYNENSFHWIIN